MTIGQRAAHMIQETAKMEGLTVSEELKLLGANRKNFHDWRNRNIDPSAYWLQQMALSGYDVFWILTGERSYPVTPDLHQPIPSELEDGGRMVPDHQTYRTCPGRVPEESVCRERLETGAHY